MELGTVEYLKHSVFIFIILQTECLAGLPEALCDSQSLKLWLSLGAIFKRQPRRLGFCLSPVWTSFNSPSLFTANFQPTR